MNICALLLCFIMPCVLHAMENPVTAPQVPTQVNQKLGSHNTMITYTQWVQNSIQKAKDFVLERFTKQQLCIALGCFFAAAGILCFTIFLKRHIDMLNRRTMKNKQLAAAIEAYIKDPIVKAIIQYELARKNTVSIIKQGESILMLASE